MSETIAMRIRAPPAENPQSHSIVSPPRIPETLLYPDSTFSAPREHHPRLPEFASVTCRSYVRFSSLCILISSAVTVFGPVTLQAQTKPLTISAIFNDPGFTADAPQGMAWSPDGTRVTYLNANGDLMAAWGGSGQTTA